MYRFKYSNKREYAEYFAEQAAQRYGAWIKSKGIDAIMAVPMYRGKKKKRGYNQAEVFARALSQKLGIPYVANGIVRVKSTTPMKNLNDLERERNLKNAFQIKENIVQYYYILVVDDIYTTGSTADAVSKMMLKSGGKTVYFLSICTGQGY
ncbi:MAG: ComF family protein [Agathobacter sp.]|nr:ComF family protein [Agathobacter sp.]